MTKKKNLFILIEQANREVDAKLLLALKAARHNYRVIVGHKGLIWSIFKFFKPGIVLLKSFGPKNTEIIDYLKKRNFKLISNDEEIIMQADIQEAVKRRFFKENLFKMDEIITNGNKDTDEIIKQFPNFEKKKIHKLGNIRFDVLKNPYNKIIKEESKIIKKEFKNFILFATQFGRANPVNIRKHSIDWVFTKIVNDNSDPNSEVIKFNKRLILMQREMLEKTIQFLDFFDNNFSGKRLVVSPHPSENIGFWENLVKSRKYKNIFINKENRFPSNRFVEACDFMITSNSTITVESYILKKKVVNYIPVDDYEDIEIQDLKEISYLVRSNNELYQIIKNNFANFSTNTKNLSIEKNLINLREEVQSIDKYINIFNGMKMEQYQSAYENKKLMFALIFKNIFRVIKKRVLDFLKINYSRRDPFMNMLGKVKIAKYLDSKEIFRKTNFFKQNNEFKDISIKQIIPKVFIIETKDKL